MVKVCLRASRRPCAAGSEKLQTEAMPTHRVTFGGAATLMVEACLRASRIPCAGADRLQTKAMLERRLILGFATQVEKACFETPKTEGTSRQIASWAHNLGGCPDRCLRRITYAWN